MTRSLGYTQFGLKVFAGSGRVGHALRLVLDVPVFEVDVNFHPSHDLVAAGAQRRILGWIESNRCIAVWLGTPCNTFSRVRDRRPGPPPLRSDSEPCGLSSLGGGDLVKVRMANRLANWSARVLETCLRLQRPAVLENPASSRLWLLPSMRRLVNKLGVSIVDQCSYGTPWRKRTGLLSTFRLVNLRARCHASGGRCSFTGAPHAQLCGKTGQAWNTKHAEKYPKDLARELAKMMASFIKERKWAQYQG